MATLLANTDLQQARERGAREYRAEMLASADNATTYRYARQDRAKHFLTPSGEVDWATSPRVGGAR